MPTDFDFADLAFPALGVAASLASPYRRDSPAGLISVLNMLAHQRQFRELQETRVHEKELARTQRQHEKEIALVQRQQEQANKFFTLGPLLQDVTLFSQANEPETRAAEDIARVKAREIPLPKLDDLPLSFPSRSPLQLREEIQRGQEPPRGQEEPLATYDLGTSYPLLPAVDQAVQSFIESTRSIPTPTYREEAATIFPSGQRVEPNTAAALRSLPFPREQQREVLTQIGALPPTPKLQEPQLEVTKAAADQRLLQGQGYPSNHPAVQALQRIQDIATRPQLQGKELQDLAIRLGFDPAFLTPVQVTTLDAAAARKAEDARSLSLIDLYKQAATAPTPQERALYQRIINKYHGDQTGAIGVHFVENEKEEVVAIWTDKRTQRVLKQEIIPGTRTGVSSFRDLLKEIVIRELAQRGAPTLPTPPAKSRAEQLEEAARRTQVPPVK